MISQNYYPIKFVWAVFAFGLFLVIFIGVVLVYLQQPQLRRDSTKIVNNSQPVNPLVPVASSEIENLNKTYQSKFGWKVTYSKAATIDTSIEKDSLSLERLTLSQLDSSQPPTGKGFNGYSVDFSVESISGSLSNFADRDSLQDATVKRGFFTATTLGGKSGYKVMIKGIQDYYTYYLPLKDPNQVLIVTTSSNGPDKEKWDAQVNLILESIELLD